MIQVTVWNENEHDRQDDVKAIYPRGLHGAIAEALIEDPARRFQTRIATLDQPAQGLPDDILNSTGVLTWWGHVRHGDVDDALVERVAERVRQGMGLIVLHSGHYSKIFRRVMGTTCRSKWWENGDRERIFTVMPGHPIAAGVPEFFELEHEETYCEHFNVPTPDELVFMSWFSGGGVLRSGLCYHYGAGRIFYFQPGHETFPTYNHPVIRQILRNAAAWAAPNGNQPPVYGKFDPMEQ